MTRQATPTTPDGDSASERDDARYQIGEVADRTGVTQRTLRFYEEKGLLTPSERMEGGFRLYSESDIARIESIKQQQSLLGLSLAEIKEMVDAEQLLEQIRTTRRPDRDLSARRKRVQQVLDALTSQREIVAHKTEQLNELGVTLDERLEGVKKRLREIDKALTEEQTEKS